MYKIYINKTLIVLKDTEHLRVEDTSDTKATLLVHYTGKKKHLSNYIDMCEKSGRLSKIVFHYEDSKQLILDFLEIYRVVPAAGGLVINEFGEILFIFRRGHWDLPKGKAEKGETKKQTAIREVQEETGISKINVLGKLSVTDHTYKSKGERLIKKSYWYLMQTKKQKLVPQVAEDIEIATWMNLEEFYKQKRKAYLSIYDVLDAYQRWLIKHHMSFDK
jgi:8-oxo-dGTP pyrophosphatase MutT (NUDIX family)